MKKQALLSLMTVGTIIATSAVSYAAWDVTTATSEGTLNFTKPVSVATVPMAAFTEEHTVGTLPVFSSNVSFTVGASGHVDTLTLEADIKDGVTSVKENFDVTFEQAGADNGLAGAVDSTIVDGENTYIVKVTPKDTTAAKELANKNLKVEITGTVSKTNI